MIVQCFSFSRIKKCLVRTTTWIPIYYIVTQVTNMHYIKPIKNVPKIKSGKMHVNEISAWGGGPKRNLTEPLPTAHSAGYTQHLECLFTLIDLHLCKKRSGNFILVRMGAYINYVVKRDGRAVVKNHYFESDFTNTGCVRSIKHPTSPSKNDSK